MDGWGGPVTLLMIASSTSSGLDDVYEDESQGNLQYYINLC